MQRSLSSMVPAIASGAAAIVLVPPRSLVGLLRRGWGLVFILSPSLGEPASRYDAKAPNRRRIPDSRCPPRRVRETGAAGCAGFFRFRPALARTWRQRRKALQSRFPDP